MFRTDHTAKTRPDVYKLDTLTTKSKKECFMLSRQLEPELMDDPQEAIIYDEMDHSEVNRRFVDDLLACGSIGCDILDLGTGTARIPIELCKRVTNCRVLASDGAQSMLEVARYNVSVSSLDSRIQLHLGDAKALEIDDETFDSVISNSLIHHLPEPLLAIQEIARLVRSGGRIFVRDLCRPVSEEAVEEIVERIAGSESVSAQTMFRQSLQAALTLDEIRSLVAGCGYPPSEVQMSSDRHWTWNSCGAQGAAE